MESIMISSRDDNHVDYYNPAAQIYAGLWTLIAGATVFLGLRLWCKLTRRHGLWYDDYVLICSYVSFHFATGLPYRSLVDSPSTLLDSKS